MMIKKLFFIVLLGHFGLASAQSITLRSGPERVHLLELYTSEGCSSCPPADDWLRDFKSDQRLWQQVVPVAFHVDYWNYLGWPDRFASQANSQRQRQLASAGGFQVYTPGFVLDGAQWRGGLFRRQLELGAPTHAGVLEAQLEKRQARISFSNGVMPSNLPLQVHLVQLGFDQQTQVQRGENFGRLLKHDFVVLSHRVKALRPVQGRFETVFELAQQPAGAVAAWVSAADDLTPLQAVGGWLNDR